MDIGFHNERITSQGCAKAFFSDFMTGLHDKLPDFRQKFRSQKRNIVNNRLVAGIVRKIAMSLANRLVLVRKFVKAVEIATRTLLPQNQNLPHVHARPSDAPVNARTNARLQQREELGSSLFVLVNVLKTSQKRRNVVARPSAARAPQIELRHH